MNAEIISVGAEVISGDVSNTDASYLSQRLGRLGITVTRHTAIDDKKESITEALAAAVARSPIIIFTGGLGPTNDDMTKEVICRAVGLELSENTDSMSRLLKYFEAKGEEMPASNRKQAMFPENAIVFENPIGTADGCAIESGNQCIIMLPGPPKELEAMFEHKVEEYLMGKTDTKMVCKTLKVFGVGESKIAEKIEDLTCLNDPVVATYVGKGDVRVKITSTGEDLAVCEQRCEVTANAIAHRLGNAVYARENVSLQETVVSLLLQQGKKIATAESCTAGMLSETLTDVPGASQVFEFGVSAYANRVKSEVLGVPEAMLKKHGAVSAQVAEAMAKGAAVKGKADLGIGITGIAGPDGGTPEKPVGTVFISLYDGARCFTRKLSCNPTHTRDKIRTTAMMNALDMVRLYLVGDSKFTAPLPQETNGGKKKKKKKWWQTLIPLKGDRPMEVVRKIIMIICLLVFIGSAAYIVDYYVQSYSNQHQQEELRNIFHQADVPLEDRFAELRKINSDIVGWLTVPGTQCDNPVVQCKDNDKYLDTTFEGEKSKYGTLYADYRNTFVDRSLSDNTIIYGHHMKDGQMFGELKQFRDYEFYKQHPVIQFTTSYDPEIVQWKIVSIFIANTTYYDASDVIFNYTTPQFDGAFEFNRFVHELRERSFIDTGVDLKYGDKLVTLSTCTYEFDDARLVVVARRVRDGESPTVDLSKTGVNPDVVTPKALKYNRYNTVKPMPSDSESQPQSVPSAPQTPGENSQPTESQPQDPNEPSQEGSSSNDTPSTDQPPESDAPISETPTDPIQ
ncbi:MAG: competence/damage-inducible protein A [Clostridia bacterium]|nr:competence/damage-inducible protein A [Clostridia bacterium]